MTKVSAHPLSRWYINDTSNIQNYTTFAQLSKAETFRYYCEELNGTWKPDARWLMGKGQNPLPY